MAIKRKISENLKQWKLRWIISGISLFVYLAWFLLIFKIGFVYNLTASIIGWNLFSLKTLAIFCVILPIIISIFTLFIPAIFVRCMEMFAKMPYFGRKMKKQLESEEVNIFYEDESGEEKKMRIRSEKLENILKGWGI